MARLPSSIKIKKNNVEYLNNIDRVQFTLFELTCMALRDSGRFITRRFKSNFYRQFKKKSGRVSSYCQFWVRKNMKYQDEPDVLIGIKPGGFYGGYQELGTEFQPKLGILQKTTMENVDEIIKIQGQYLSALNEEDPLNGVVIAEEYTGGAEVE